MPHPVGGAMGVALCTAVKRGHTHFDIISLNIHKQLRAGICLGFLLGTGRMPHPVGGAMGVTRVCREKWIHPL